MTAGASAVLMVIAGGTAGIAVLTAEDEPRIVTAIGAGQQGREVLQPAADPGSTGGGGLPSSADPGLSSGGGLPSPAEPAPARDEGLRSQGEPAPASGGGGAITPAPTQKAADAVRRTPKEGDRTATRTPRKEELPSVAAPSVPGTKAAKPAVTTRTEVERRATPFRTRLVRDPQLERGQIRIRTPGATGEEVLRWTVRVENGRETERRLVTRVVTREPRDRVVAFGTERRDCRDDRCGDGAPGRRKASCEKPAESAESDLGAINELDGRELGAGLLC